MADWTGMTPLEFIDEAGEVVGVSAAGKGAINDIFDGVELSKKVIGFIENGRIYIDEEYTDGEDS
jgi:hypothetical protein